MKFNQYEIANLSSMICGDRPFKKIFPYRKIEKISDFFQNIGLDYSYDNTTTRKLWVESVITDINNKANPDDDDLSPAMKDVIRAMLNQNDFSDLVFTNYEKAKKTVEKLLKQHGIKINDIIEPHSHVNNRTSQEIPSIRQRKPDQIDQYLHILPQFFTKPSKPIDNDKISVMMPLSTDFNEVYTTIRHSCESEEMRCYRADHVWNDSIIIQDIFELIYTSKIVIADFSMRNPNVFYEVGIAHTLGKHVIPIAQNISDVPFDLHHHRVLVYHNNNEGRDELRKKLSMRIKTLKEKFLGEV